MCHTSLGNLGNYQTMIRLEIIDLALVHDIDADLVVRTILATVEIVASVPGRIGACPARIEPANPVRPLIFVWHCRIGTLASA
jgi:hypothetical protein